MDICTQDVLDWIVGDVMYTGRRSEEFEMTKIDADVMLEAELGEDKNIYLHIEAQSTPDDDMAHRLLVYNARARERYKCPIESYVIYLRKGGKRPQPPLVWHSLRGKQIMHFDYTVIELHDYSTEELFATGLRGILPLIPFAHDGKRRDVVEQIIARLLPAHDTISKELLALTQLFASLAFEDIDQEWLIRRFAVAQDMFADTPVYQHILSIGEEKGLEKGKEEGIALGIEKGIALGKEEGIVLGIEKGRQEATRQMLLTLVMQRFPRLKTLAKGQLSLIEQPQILENLFLKIALARTQEDVQNHLLTWDGQSET